MRYYYRVKLLKGHTAQEDQQVDGYLAFYGIIQRYSRSEAIKKARLFGGKIESKERKVKPMTLTHSKPGNIARYDGQIWLICQASKKTVSLVRFDSSKAHVKLNTKAPAGPPVYLADNPTSYVIGLLTETY